MNKKSTDDSLVFVTQPYLPPFEEFVPYLKEIWENKWVTNNGPFHKEFEKKLCEFLGVKYICLFSNGMLALMTALRALNIEGEVITTPFSFVATSHALLLNNITPVFVDIEPETYNLDPDKIEAAITSRTSAILPVHVYGNPCNIDKIQEIADRHGLKVIYDAAHAFGVKLNGASLAGFGDLSVLSFHGTKVFNTFEGGAIVCHDEKMKETIDQLKNFGITGETTVVLTGLNAKMNEFQAALGVLQLKYFETAVLKRKRIFELYYESLKNFQGVSILQSKHNIQHNYGYFTILIDGRIFGKSRDEVYDILKSHNLFSRRYFYPLINQFPMYKHLKSSFKGSMPVAEKISGEVLCLPIYPDLSEVTIHKILSIIGDK
jgi:dTDP-4-amino-4,6-dideoxygalactose transaminase